MPNEKQLHAEVGHYANDQKQSDIPLPIHTSEDTDYKKHSPNSHSVNLYPLYDQFDINHIHGLRNRLFRTFYEFSSILENALLPPVFESAKKIQIKIKECDQLPNYTFDLNSLISEIKKESKNEDLHKKYNKTIRKFFQVKLIKCYKLAINATKLCSKNLAAGMYNPIQSEMKSLIQIIKILSLVTGKYLYGKIYKQKKEESFDLVQKCNDVGYMLEEFNIKDIDNNYSNNIDNNKALIKPKNSNNSNRLSMYYKEKPKLGSCYAQGWSKKSVELTNNKVLTNNLDDVKTVMEELNEKNYFKEIPVISSKVLSKQLKTTSNVGLFIIKENIWRNFPIKNLRLSQNGAIILNIIPGEAKQHNLYTRQLKEHSLKTENKLKILLNITESIIDDLINEVLSKIDYDSIINKLIVMELLE